jgi:hypothetical protein
MTDNNDIEAFPTMHDVLVHGDNIITLEAGSAIKAGQVVSIATDGAADPSVANLAAIGVALYDAALGDKFAVACVGCMVNVANATSDVAIDAGVEVICNDCAVGGTVSVATGTLGEDATEYIVGVTIDPIAGDGTGKIMLMPHVAAGPNVDGT